MSKINFPKKQEQRLIPKYLLEYSEELVKNHPDPTADWGGGSGGSPIEAGEGIIITGTDTKTISVDAEDVALVKNLATVAFSGSYNDLSGKPDLSVYELKSEAFTGDYADLTNKPDLSVYELKTDAFSGNYNDLTNKPALATVATSGNYNDLTNKPTIPDAVSGTNDGTNWTSLTIGSDTYGLAGGGSTPTNMVTTNTQQTISGDKTFTGALSRYYIAPIGGVYQRLSIDPAALIYQDSTGGAAATTTLAFSSNTTGSSARVVIPNANGTLALTSDIPTVPTNVSSFTNDAGYLTSSDLTYYVTTNTQQTIGAQKTFKGNKLITLQQSGTNDKPGFTLYDKNVNEKGYLEYNPSDNGLYLGRYGSNGVNELGFLSQKQSNLGLKHKLLVPNVTITQNTTDYIPISVNNTKADSTGNISLAIPTKTSDLTNDSGYITGIDSTDVITALGYTPGTSNFSGDYTDLTNKPDLSIYAETSDLATVATTGAYSDLTGTPTIPTDTSDLTNGAGFITSSALSGYATETWVGNQGYLTSVSWSDVSNKPTFATVATSGDYDDLLNKPTIPTVPTNVSAFTNDAGYITNSVNNLTNYTLSSSLATVATSGSYNDLSNKPSIPTYNTLFSTTPTSGTTVYTINLSDDITNYDEIHIFYNVNDSTAYKYSTVVGPLVTNDQIFLECLGHGTSRLYTKTDCFKVNTTTQLTLVSSIQQRVGNNEATTISVNTDQCRCRPYKIVGIKY